MKATVWLWPIVTLICASSFVCVCAQQEYKSYADFPSDNSLIQDYLAERNKRAKSSLSIVNPIDVLRQRLLLEIARRQMKENTKQVELNRAYLKNIGKRGHKQLLLQQEPNNQYSQIQNKIPALTVPMSSSSSLEQHQQNQEHQLLQQQNRNQDQMQRNSNKILFDFLRQRQQQQPQQQQQQHENGNIRIGDGDPISTSVLIADDLKDNIDMSDNNEINDNNNDDDDYQMRYLYRLHKNRFSKE